MRLSRLHTDDAVLAELGRRLERIRLDRNLTQDEVAHEAGISRQTLGRIEAGGAAKLPAFLRVLRALGLLEGIELLVPEPLPSPIQLLEQQGRQRQRARRRDARQTDPRHSGSWTWGPE
ncbi:MAG: helix-turn-helix transcriptional regulator [Tepidisphaeraceae bacterium]